MKELEFQNMKHALVILGMNGDMDNGVLLIYESQQQESDFKSFGYFGNMLLKHFKNHCTDKNNNLKFTL